MIRPSTLTLLQFQIPMQPFPMGHPLQVPNGPPSWQASTWATGMLPFGTWLLGVKMGMHALFLTCFGICFLQLTLFETLAIALVHHECASR